MTTIPIQFREVDGRDVESPEYAFVIATWLHSYRERALWEGMRPSAYYHIYHRYLTGLMLENQVLLASLEGDGDCFVGWACGYPRPPQIHYVHVKRAYQRDGIGAQLIRGVAGNRPGIFTFDTGLPSERWFARGLKAKGWRYIQHEIGKDRSYDKQQKQSEEQAGWEHGRLKGQKLGWENGVWHDGNGGTVSPGAAPEQPGHQGEGSARNDGPATDAQPGPGRGDTSVSREGVGRDDRSGDSGTHAEAVPRASGPQGPDPGPTPKLSAPGPERPAADTSEPRQDSELPEQDQTAGE